MNYISVTEIAKKWGISERSVRNYCAEGRVEGAILVGKTWTIPENAEKPGRKKKTTSAPQTLLDILKAEKAANERAMELLDFMGLADVADQKAGSLPYGVQRRLEIVRALASNPSIILLDEPAAGMNPSETAELMHQIRRIRDTFHIAIFLIEHDMNLVMNVCEAIAVVNYGRIIAKGTPEEIRENPAVIEAYLGKQED